MTKGTVKVESVNNRLRLRWTVGGKTHTIGLRLDDTAINRKIAESKATQIQLDILSNNFDETLEKYKQKQLVGNARNKRKTLTFSQLWQEYTKERAKDLAERTIKDKFKSLQKRIDDFDKDIKTQSDAEKFSDYLASWNSPKQILDKIISCSAAYDWGIANGYAQINWFERIKSQVKVEHKQEVKPFTAEEIRTILDGFQYPKYCHYYEYVQFLFLTGCRTSEAIGLQWKHINDDFSEVWIGESLTRGIRKGTKTNKPRIFPVNGQLKKLLKTRYLQKADLIKASNQEMLVFTSPSGKPINDMNFSSRVWKQCLEDMGVEHRPQYNTRHTFISHALANGMEPVKIAKVTGHDVKVLYEKYAGVISRIEIPELQLT